MSNPNSPTFRFDHLPLHWQMSRWEKYAFASLLETVNPELAIEVGTYQGGSLQIIASKAAQVYSIDISESCREELGDQFPNVTFLTGNSKQLLPELLGSIQQERRNLGFILIDGDHSTEGVRDDINSVLQYVPTVPLYVVCHDSFNPACRKGMLQAAWSSSPYVHYVEIDYIPGTWHFEGFDTAEPKSMFGGFALACLKPQPREGELVVHQSLRGTFDTIYPRSSHVRSLLRPPKFLRKMARRVFR